MSRPVIVLALLMVAGAAAGGFTAAREIPKMDQIVIVPVGGNIATERLRFLAQPLEQTFSARVTFGARIPLPGHAYNRERNQYLSNVVLDVVRSRMTLPEQSRGLAVTNEDLYVSDLNFVFGQADLYAGISIISLARLRPEFYGAPPDEALFHSRAITEAVHEIAHTLGIADHCANAKCVMHFSNTLADTDRKGHRFCQRCRRILGIGAGG